MQLFESDIS